MHHEMDSTVRIHCIYKSMICEVISNRRTTHPREGACRPIHTMNLQYVHCSNNRFSDSWPQSIGNLFTDHMVLEALLSTVCLFGICHITGRRSRRKGLEVPCKYSYYCGPTKDPALIQDLVFIFATIVFPWPLNKTRHVYETSHNSRQ